MEEFDAIGKRVARPNDLVETKSTAVNVIRVPGGWIEIISLPIEGERSAPDSVRIAAENAADVIISFEVVVYVVKTHQNIVENAGSIANQDFLKCYT